MPGNMKGHTMHRETLRKIISQPTKAQEELRRHLADCKRVSLEDKKILSRNLGSLAEAINPTNPKAAIKQIIAQSGLKGAVEDKPKRYFQLDGDKEPKEGFATEGLKFVKLAEVAGELNCSVKRDDYKKKARYEAIQKLAHGTSFAPALPHNSHENQALQAVIDEYCVRVAEAIGDRSKIQDLWTSLRSTPVTIESQYLDKNTPPSPWGKAACVPEDIITAAGRQFLFSPNDAPEYAHYEVWSEPAVELGHISISHKVRLFTIPKSMRELFTSELYRGEADLPALRRLNSWLESIGYSEADSLLSEDDDAEVGSWQNYNICFVYKVYINAKEKSDGTISLGMKLEPIPYGEFEMTGQTLSFLSSNSHGATQAVENYCLTQEAGPVGLECILQPDLTGEYDFENQDNLVFIQTFYDRAFDGTVLGPVAFADSSWQTFNSNFWIEDIELEEFQSLQGLDVELSDPRAQKLLYGTDRIKFFPSIAQSESIAGAARRGSIAASILHNLDHADDENLISNKLLKVSQVTAASGLNFISSMIEKHRTSLARI
ncbi:hypothetical protein NIG5292_02346 [Nereida ignava]|uniref:Uncharacterized protein n=2 Tax=Nereida ignava TaxID=282199 RepID=A0A0U1NP69_9RHOB|nr:hypothetical protein NIG5292_02346 [Nereida ignava]SFJ81693.1 hypothetical protein SAMN02745667_02464 [Nereida ignava DSM 16309]